MYLHVNSNATESNVMSASRHTYIIINYICNIITCVSAYVQIKQKHVSDGTKKAGPGAAQTILGRASWLQISALRPFSGHSQAILRPFSGHSTLFMFLPLNLDLI